MSSNPYSWLAALTGFFILLIVVGIVSVNVIVPEESPVHITVGNPEPAPVPTETVNATPTCPPCPCLEVTGR